MRSRPLQSFISGGGCEYSDCAEEHQAANGVKEFLVAALLLLVNAVPVTVRADASYRYGGHGPNWWEVPCGLPCFRVWELESGGLDSLAVGAENLRRVRTVDEMRALIAKAWMEIDRRKGR